MSKTIWKFPLLVNPDQYISMPKDAQILTVEIQVDQICLWALVIPENPKEDRRIEMFGTGHTVTLASRTYLGTVQSWGGQVVYHIFERHV